MLKLLSKYRSELMGIATLWVILFHFRENFQSAPIDWLASIGYGGVDIFLFLSGFGLYFGFQRSKNLNDFYLKRFKRVYPFYLFVIIVASILKHEYNPLFILMKSIGLGYFLPFITNAFYEWYVPTVLVLYLIYPLIFKLLNDNMLKWGGVMIAIGIFLTGILIVMQKGTIILSVSRIPVFVMGCIAACLLNQQIPLKKKYVLSFCIISIVAMIIEIYLVHKFDNIFLWRNAIYWLPFILITPGLCFVLCYFFERIKMRDSNILKFIGGLSLEAYLIHVLCLGYYRNWCLQFIEDSNIKLWLVFMLFLIIVLCISYIVHKIYAKLIYELSSAKY